MILSSLYKQKYVNTLETTSSKMSSDSVFTPKRPPVVFETLNHEYSIGTFIEQYQHAMPQLVMVRRGFCGETIKTIKTVLSIHTGYGPMVNICKFVLKL
jgi:hypothetical protein